MSDPDVGTVSHGGCRNTVQLIVKRKTHTGTDEKPRAGVGTTGRGK